MILISFANKLTVIKEIIIKKFNIKIDTEGPLCDDNPDGVSTTWASSRTITYKCTDKGAGCKLPKISKTYDGSVSTEKFEYDFEDTLGNTTHCIKENVNVYVDNERPSVPTTSVTYNGTKMTNLSSFNEGWTNQNIIWNDFASIDAGSGIDHYEYSDGCTGTKTGNRPTDTTFPSNGTNSNLTYCIRAVDKAGNVGAWSNKYIFQIDKVAPTCTNVINKCHKDDKGNVIMDEAINSGVRVNSYVNVKPTCSDTGGSGCNASATTVTTTGATKNHTDYKISYFRVQASGESTVTFKIYDKAGNETICPAVSLEKNLIF